MIESQSAWLIFPECLLFSFAPGTHAKPFLLIGNGFFLSPWNQIPNTPNGMRTPNCAAALPEHAEQRVNGALGLAGSMYGEHSIECGFIRIPYALRIYSHSFIGCEY